MSMWNYLCRVFRRYVFSPESILFCILLIIIYNTFVNFSPLWQKAKLKFRVGSSTVNNPFNNPNRSKFRSNGVLVDGDSGKVSWDEKSKQAAVYSIQGRRPHMEDRFRIVNNQEDNKVELYGIFDGHGGEAVAEYAQERLFPAVLSNTDDTSSDQHGALLTKHILDLDNEILEFLKEKSDISGSTALVAMVSGMTLTVANVGDSRGVMCDRHGKAVPLSIDHKPEQMREHARIKDAGGFVAFNGVWRVAGILATSRALGDYTLKEKNFVIAEPDIKTFNLLEVQPKFLILASDGLWDCFTNEEAVDYIKDRLDEPHFGAKSIVLQAYYKGSLDNISVMVVKFDSKDFVKKQS